MPRIYPILYIRQTRLHTSTGVCKLRVNYAGGTVIKFICCYVCDYN
jgi:hypothetical protein